MKEMEVILPQYFGHAVKLFFLFGVQIQQRNFSEQVKHIGPNFLDDNSLGPSY